MIEQLPELVNGQPRLVHRGRFVNETFMVEVGGTQYLVTIAAGAVAKVEAGPFVMRSWRFAIRAASDIWERFWQPVPAPGYHDIFALLRKGEVVFEGDMRAFMANLLYYKLVLAAPRSLAEDARGGRAMVPRIEPITGRYIHMEVNGRPHRVYFEEAGEGIPLLCLHTAGSDTRQFRAVLNDPEILSRYRVIAFDMPWHGKSSPPDGWQDEDYRLTTEDYTGMIEDVIGALALDRPVVMGCSIGGRIVLHLALDHPERYRALIGLQSAASVEKYYDPMWLNHPEVHGGQSCGAIAYGLCSPRSPSSEVWETVWHYMQGGPGVFTGDLFFYQVHGDIRARIGQIDTGKCPLFMLTGEYDYSASPKDTRAAAALIQGAQVTIMEGLGHFPMSENPEGFLGYLRPVLSKIATLES